MKTSVNYNEIVKQLTNVFANESMTQDYNATNPLYDGICGWCGVMAPLSRPAYVETFGEILTARAEKEARQIVAEKAQTFANSEYMKHAKEADALQGVPTVGGFFWAYNSGLKCDSGEGLAQELHALTCYNTAEELAKGGARLCQVREVFTVSAEEFDRPGLADELVKAHELAGGCCSDDIAEGANWYDLTDEDRATLYTFGAMVTDGVRFYLIDSEGYSYARYIYVPKSWRTMYAPELAEIERKENERKAAEAKAEAEAKAARRAEYVARCEKWQKLMQDVRPLEDAERKAWEAYTKGGYKKNSPEEKAHKTAKRKAMNARKSNILAMCRAAFPGVKFSVSVRHGWGADWSLSWVDGPTAEEFGERCDLDLFRSSWDTFDGMDDSTGTGYAEFTDFSALTMGSNAGNIETERTMSEEAKGAIFAEVLAVAPEYDDRNAYGYYNEIDVTPEKAKQVGEAVGVAASALYYDHWHGMDYRLSLEQLARRVWNMRSYTTAETSPTEPTDPKGGKAQEVEAVAGGNAPEGLELIETAEGVAVVGDSRTTYRHRKEIKAHGAKWNKTAQRWEAVDAEGVESLRQWFGVDSLQEAEDITENEDEAETVSRYVLVFDEDWDNIAEYDSYQTDDLNDAINEACRVYAEEGLHCVDIYDRQTDAVVWTTEDETTDNEPEPEPTAPRSELVAVVAVAKYFGGIEWGTSCILSDGDTVEVLADDPEALHQWDKTGRPLNRCACVKLYGEDITAEGEALHNVADRSAHRTEDGDYFAEWWEAVTALQSAQDITEGAESADPFEGAPQHVRELVDEIKAKPTEGEHGEKRAELLALIAEQWQELGEKFAEVVEFINDKGARIEGEGVELRARRVVALASSRMADKSRRKATYLRSCDLGDFFTDNPETTAPRYDVAEKSETAEKLPKGDDVRPFCVSCVYDSYAGTVRRAFSRCDSVDHITKLDRNKRREENAELLEYYSSFVDFHGLTLRYRFKGTRRYFLLFCTALPDHIRPEYSQELAELREWAHNLEEQEERKRYAV